MNSKVIGSRAAVSVVEGCLVVSVQADLYDDLLERIREGVLDKVYSKTLKGVIFDMSSVKVMDSYVFNHLADTARMTVLLGVESLFVGFHPGAVSALVDLDVDTTSVRSVRVMDDAIKHFTSLENLQASTSRCEESEEDGERVSPFPEDDQQTGETSGDVLPG